MAIVANTGIVPPDELQALIRISAAAQELHQAGLSADLNAASAGQSMAALDIMSAAGGASAEIGRCLTLAQHLVASGQVQAAH